MFGLRSRKIFSVLCHQNIKQYIHHASIHAREMLDKVVLGAAAPVRLLRLQGAFKSNERQKLQGKLQGY